MRSHRTRAAHGVRHAALVLLFALACMMVAPTPALAADVQNASGTPNVALSVDPTGKREGFSTVLYDSMSGLPTSEANAIAETPDGFIWIGSYAGLIRYDGNSFVRFDATTGITSVICLYVDSQGRLWIGTNTDGVALMEPEGFRMWGVEDGLASASVRAITEDAAGTLYVATTAGVAIIDADGTLTPVADPRISGEYIRDIRVGADGLVWGLTQVGDVFTCRDGAVETFLGHEDAQVDGIIGLLPDPSEPGWAYLGTESSQVFHGSLASGFADAEAQDISPLSYVERFELIDGKLWVCAGNGIGSFDEGGFQLLENVPLDNSVGHAMTDYEGNLWFTSTRQGVMKVVPNQFADLFERDDLDEAVVNATCLSGGRLFIATDAGLIVTEDGARVESLPLTSATTAGGTDLGTTDLLSYLDGVRIRSITRDGQGRLWIATWRRHGLLRYQANATGTSGELVAFTEEDGLFSDRVRVACERADGAVMVASTGGVSIIEGHAVTHGYGRGEGIENTEVLTVAEGTGGDMLVGTDGGGIYVIGAQGVRHIGIADGLGSEVVMRIKRDVSRDLYWIVTANSLAFMDADYQVTTVERFPYSNNFDLYESDQGEIWVLASNGIYVTPVEELLANGEIHPQFLSHDDGLPCITTANSYSELTDDGDLYIAGTTGVAKVNIDHPASDIARLKVALPYVEADGVMVWPDEDGSFRIPASTRKLTVSAYVFNYSLTNPQVSYHLEGFEQDVTTVSRSDLAPVDYTNLRGGSYRFVLQLADAVVDETAEASFVIVKERHPWENGWFMALVAAAAAAVLAGVVRAYVRSRTRKLEAKNRETMTLVGEITEAFAKVIDMKDRYTNGHSTRVAHYTAMLTRELGYDEETVERYYRIALLHDIGKVGVPSEVLNKPGKLTDEEFQTIKSHTTLGYEALKDISIMPELATGAGAHHERPDGRGYPQGLAGDEIPRVAQIIAVADCFDAMYSNRPYRKRMNFEKVVSIITEVSGTQLTPDVVDAFLRLVEKGEFRDPDDDGGGSTEEVDNVRKG